MRVNAKFATAEYNYNSVLDALRYARFSLHP